MRLHRFLPGLLLAGALCAATDEARAQTLRGSPGAVARAYRQAHDHDLTFYKSGRSVRSAASSGDLVRLRGNADYRVADADYPYAQPATRLFVQRLARQYRSECGERLVVTSAVRPTSLRLWNSVEKTVHPTGMAVDLRKPRRARCLRWLRETLLAVEGRGAIDATEEHRPPHFHVVVFPGPYRRYVSRAGGETAPAAEGAAPRSTRRRSAARATTAPASASSSPSSRTRTAQAPRRPTYRVRRGDSLWTIARRHGVSVDRIKDANDMRSARIRAGQVLVIPTGR